MTIKDSPPPREYFYLTWQISSLGRRTALAAAGFLFESFIALVLIVLAVNHTDNQSYLLDNLSTVLFFIALFILPVSLACWWIWRRDAARLRELNTRLLNNFSDEDRFMVPHMSPLTMKYAPEAAAVLTLQAIAAVCFSAFVL